MFGWVLQEKDSRRQEDREHGRDRREKEQERDRDGRERSGNGKRREAADSGRPERRADPKLREAEQELRDRALEALKQRQNSEGEAGASKPDVNENQEGNGIVVATSPVPEQAEDLVEMEDKGEKRRRRSASVENGSVAKIAKHKRKKHKKEKHSRRDEEE